MPAGPLTAVVSLTVMAGFTSAPLNPGFREQEFDTYFSKLKIKAIIVEKDCETAARAVAASRSLPVIEVTPSMDTAGIYTFGPMFSDDTNGAVFASPSDIALLLQTSGTTSVPKIVPFTQKQLCASVHVYSALFGQGNLDRSLHIVPYYHLLGLLGTFLTPLAGGGTVICTKNFVPSDFFPLLRTYHPTYYVAGPAHHQAILSEIREIPPEELINNSLRIIRSTSAALPITVLREIEALLGATLIESYAMTESPYISVNFPYKAGSVGIPTNISLIITDENGHALQPDEPGEIAIRGEGVFSGYEDAPDENASAFINGWFRTGDMGYLDEDGYLFITGRKKELINKGGEKISPAEIDAVLIGHPLVDQAMAFRINDPVLGEDIAAMVVPVHGDVSENVLRDYLLDHLVPFKVPKRIYFVDTIPRGATGKPLRFVGTDRYSHEQCFDKKTDQPVKTSPHDLSSHQEILARIWKDILDIDSLSADDDFFRCGGNSLTAIVLLIRIQRIFHLNFPADTIYRNPTIRDQTGLITGKLGNTGRYHPLIVPIHGKGTLPPLFCVHPLGGWIKEYQYISLFFDRARPVFGIRARGMEPAEKPVLTVEEAVPEYIDAIKTVQKEGPYHLLGFSGGAIYAFELACQLKGRGESVPFLGIIDMSVPPPQRSLFNLTRGPGPSRLITAGYSLYSFLNNRLKTKPDGFAYILFIKCVTVFSRGILFLRDFRSRPASGSDIEYIGAEESWISTLPEQQQMIVRTQIRAISLYKPRIFSGDIHLFSTGPDFECYPDDPARGWNSYLTGKTFIKDIPGDHDSLHTEPLGQVTAKKIEESLDLVDGHAQ
jgi:acyl-CoA synthetase (AMP-forming)/AMP-acid ligase II/thioesterase domain-containing protein